MRLQLTGASPELAARLTARVSAQWPGIFDDTDGPGITVPVDGLPDDAAWFAVAVRLGCSLAGPAVRPPRPRRSDGLSRRELFGMFKVGIGDALQSAPLASESSVGMALDIVKEFAVGRPPINVVFACGEVPVMPWTAGLGVADVGAVNARWLMRASASGAAVVVVNCVDGECGGRDAARQAVATASTASDGAAVVYVDGVLDAAILGDARGAQPSSETVMCRVCGAPIGPYAMLAKVAQLLGTEVEDLCPECKAASRRYTTPTG